MTDDSEKSVKHTVKVKLYSIVSDAIERGVGFGYQRAHKHTDEPDVDAIVEEIRNAVLNELDEIISFDD